MRNTAIVHRYSIDVKQINYNELIFNQLLNYTPAIVLYYRWVAWMEVIIWILIWTGMELEMEIEYWVAYCVNDEKAKLKYNLVR